MESNMKVLIVVLFTGCVLAQSVPKCQSFPPYYTIVRDRTDSVLSDVLVKSGPGPFRCAYRPGPADYQIRGVLANEFVKFAARYLFVGGGSGPDGGTFAVYDLQARQKVYEHEYAGKGLQVIGSTITYTKTLGAATRATCRKFDEIAKMSLRPVIEADVSFPVQDLSTPEKLKNLKPLRQRCVAHQ